MAVDAATPIGKITTVYCSLQQWPTMDHNGSEWVKMGPTGVPEYLTSSSRERENVEGELKRRLAVGSIKRKIRSASSTQYLLFIIR